MKWDLTNYYKTYEDFREELKKANELVDSLKAYEGKLNDPSCFKEYFDKQIYLTENYYKLYLYAECKMDLDRRVQEGIKDMQEVSFLFNKLGENTSFESSEILSLDEAYIDKMLEENDELKQFRYSFDNLYRRKAHTLSKEGEGVIAAYQALSNAGCDTYDSLSSGDIKEHVIKLDNGEDVNVCDANWTKLIGDSKNEEERKRIFEAEFKRFDYNKNTYAAIYNSVLQADIALAKARGFDSALEMHLFSNNIPVSLYHNLIKIAHDSSPIIKKYYDLKKNVLKLSKYHTYDRFLELVQNDNEKEYTYDEARNLFFDSIERFDDEFKANAHEAVKDGYVDVMPGIGKRPGAYSNNTPKVHPCILLNFNGSLDSCFTLAHEAGHSTHSLFSMNAQPVMTESYTIFVAEIASTFNEHNLLDYLLTKGTLSKNERIKLIQNAIDGILATFIRQTLFGEYEYLAHKLAEEGRAITEESLSNIMINLYKEYYGLDINDEVYKKYVWAYVGHFFHSPYYVYQYATSYAASLAIYQNVKEGKPNAFNMYKDLLKSGGSDYPINLVKKAGVDFTKTEALESVTKRLNDLVNELEKAINE